MFISVGFDCVPRGFVYFRQIENSSQTSWHLVRASLFPYGNGRGAPNADSIVMYGKSQCLYTKRNISSAFL